MTKKMNANEIESGGKLLQWWKDAQLIEHIPGEENETLLQQLTKIYIFKYLCQQKKIEMQQRTLMEGPFCRLSQAYPNVTVDCFRHAWTLLGLCTFDNDALSLSAPVNSE